MDASVNRIPTARDESALLISLKLPDTDEISSELSLRELELLVKTAGARVQRTMTVRRQKIDPALVLGKGKVDEIKGIIEELKITLTVFDLTEIKPAQIRNLEEILKCRIVGRTEIILDIFARRARSSESKIQVELAQLRYILPRLKGLGGVLSRLGGGIGTRGPGEKMLETDRRHVIKRIAKLQDRLKEIRAHRERTRKKRDSIFTGAVVGYTNGGKSTLINLLARDDLFVEDRLFATLDSFTRRVYLTDKLSILLTDTVGFIRHLPSNLVESFRSTLEEIGQADFILHIVDINSEDIENHISVVENELSSLKKEDTPVILFFSKSDAADENLKNYISHKYLGSVVGSSLSGEGIEKLKGIIAEICTPGKISF